MHAFDALARHFWANEVSLCKGLQGFTRVYVSALGFAEFKLTSLVGVLHKPIS